MSKKSFVILFVLSMAMSLSAQTVVGSAKDFIAALSNLQPGDELVLKDGSYDISGVKITKSGEENNPIVIRAEHTGKVVFIGKSNITLSRTKYITLQGFEFASDALTAIKTESAQHCRITECVFHMKEPLDDTKYPWIRVGAFYADTVNQSFYNRIDHNVFENKTHTGNFITLEGIKGCQTQHDLIDNNTFRSITPRSENEKEAIRIGDSDVCMSDGFTVVENNVFEDCDGDPEIVSVKSCRDTIRNNIFRRCCGTLSLRQGVYSYVEGNQFYGEGKTALSFDGLSTIGCGGIRAYSLGHKIVNNFMEGLTGNKFDAAFVLTNGDKTNTESNFASSPSAHFIPENILFAHNTIKNCKSNIEVGYKYTKNPKNDTIVYNTIIGSTPFMIVYNNGKDSVSYYSEKVGGSASSFVIHDNVLQATTDEIRTVTHNNSNSNRNDSIFNLSGQKITDLKNSSDGVYIVNRRIKIIKH